MVRLLIEADADDDVESRFPEGGSYPDAPRGYGRTRQGGEGAAQGEREPVVAVGLLISLDLTYT